MVLQLVKWFEFVVIPSFQLYLLLDCNELEDQTNHI